MAGNVTVLPRALSMAAARRVNGRRAPGPWPPRALSMAALVPDGPDEWGTIRPVRHASQPGVTGETAGGHAAAAGDAADRHVRARPLPARRRLQRARAERSIERPGDRGAIPVPTCGPRLRVH